MDSARQNKRGEKTKSAKETWKKRNYVLLNLPTPSIFEDFVEVTNNRDTITTSSLTEGITENVPEHFVCCL